MEITPDSSAKKVAYDLRPAKQIERRMMIEALQRIGQAGVRISEYKYIGFGALTYIDFILFYKLLGIRRLLSVEYDDSIGRRVEFNKPYGEIDVYIGSMYQAMDEVSRDDNYIIWLDYDFSVGSVASDDIEKAARLLPSGSFLIVTVDAEPPSGELDPEEPDTPKSWRSYFERECGRFMDPAWKTKDFAKSLIPKRSIDIVNNMITHGLRGRKVDFHPIFSFDYGDGHRMITIGGILGGSREKEIIGSGWLDSCKYLRFDLTGDPYRIRVPRVTRRERLYLDQHMPCDDGWTPNDFEMDVEDVNKYREVFRFFPAFGELLLE